MLLKEDTSVHAYFKILQKLGSKAETGPYGQTLLPFLAGKKSKTVPPFFSIESNKIKQKG